MEFMQRYARMLWWMGPWASQDAKPDGVVRRRIVIPASAPDQRSFDAYYYLPADRPADGAYLIVPGLHHLGPSDPRLDRFCRVLAHAGIATLSPFIADFQDHLLTKRAVEDARRAFRHMRTLPGQPAGRPGVWCISLGSVLAFSVAGHPELAEQIGGVYCFGGYANWTRTIEFSLTGLSADGTEIPRDPLNQPAVYMNVYPGLEGAPADPSVLFGAWRRYMRATWGRPHFRAGLGHLDVAHAMALDLPPEQRALFLDGCGARPGSAERAVLAMRSCPPGTFDHCDPLPWLAQVRCPVHIAHAAEDNVIPIDQQQAIADALPPNVPVHLYTTGLFGHSDADASVLSPHRWREAVDEVATMLRMVEGILDAATDRHR